MAADGSTLLQIPFVGGLDERTAPEWLDAAAHQASVVNGNFTKAGAIDKRRGVKLLSTHVVQADPFITPIQLATPRRVAFTARSGMLAMSANALYGRTEALDGVAHLSQLPNAGVRRTGIPGDANTSAPVLCDFGDSLRLSVFVQKDINGQYTPMATVFDRDTGEVVVQPIALDVAMNPTVNATHYRIAQVLLLADELHVAVVYWVGRQDYRAVIYDVAGNAFSAPIVTAVGAGPNAFDACAIVGDPAAGFLVLYQLQSTNNLVLALHDVTGAVVRSTFVTNARQPTGNVSICANYGERVWITWIRVASVVGHHDWVLKTYATDILSSTAEAILSSPSVAFFLGPIARVDATHAWLSLLVDSRGLGGTIDAVFGSQFRVDATGAGHEMAWPLAMWPVGKPVVDSDGTVYCPCFCNLVPGTTTAGNNTLYLVRFAPTFVDPETDLKVATRVLPVATVAPRACFLDNWIPSGFIGVLPYPVMSSGATTALPTSAGFGFQMQTDVSTATAFAADFDFDDDALFQVDELGDGVHISGGVPMTFDGTTCFEDSFFYYPEGSYSTLVAGTVPVGTYNLAVIYRRTDANGNQHRSAPFFLPQIAPGAFGGVAKSIAVNVPQYSMAYGDATGECQVYADVYMTQSAGSVYYKIASVQATPNYTVGGITWLASGQIVTATIAAAPLGTEPLLYTQGGALDGVNPPAARCQTVFKNRLVIVDETGSMAWVSQAFVPGAAVSFNEELTQPLSDGGPIVAVRTLDDKLVFYKQSSIWIMYGDGPSVAGTGSDFTEPQKIESDVGALDWRSIVLTPKGHLFRARAGFFLLGRDLSVTFVGKQVEDTLAAFPNVTSATLVPSAQQVRFTCVNDAGTASIIIAYDYFHDAWTKHVAPHIPDGASSPPFGIVSSCLADDKFTFIVSSGPAAPGGSFKVLWQERDPADGALYFDDYVGGGTVFVPTVITTAWVKLQGIQGYQRARRVLVYGQRKTNHGFQFDVAVNYDPTSQQTVTRLSSTLTKDQVEFHVGSKLTKQESIQITIRDTPDGADGNGQGCIFTSLALELQKVGDRYRKLAPGSSFLISAVTPNNGLAAGGDSVAVTGAGFRDASDVLFDGIPGTAIDVVSDTEIQITTPAHAPGAVDIAVVTPKGKRVLAGAFTFT